MPSVRRSTTLRATPEQLWAIVGDVHHLPRWWPGVARVEGVRRDAFTQVLRTPKGALVRADFRIVESQAPRLLRWAQQLSGTPFERILAASEVTVRLDRADDGATCAAIELDQRLRGMALLGSWMARTAARRQLDGAVSGLQALVAP